MALNFLYWKQNAKTFYKHSGAFLEPNALNSEFGRGKWIWLKFNNCADLDRPWLWLWFPHMHAIGPPSEWKSAISSFSQKRKQHHNKNRDVHAWRKYGAGKGREKVWWYEGSVALGSLHALVHLRRQKKGNGVWRVGGSEFFLLECCLSLKWHMIFPLWSLSKYNELASLSYLLWLLSLRSCETAYNFAVYDRESVYTGTD